ncbi:hypothetical protein, partial [Gemmobacter aquatilis]|uniref:hypothetical protein n=1 Tax=Gemmobacter aquatilis TaxID=933059 RepID=UPI001C316E64
SEAVTYIIAEASRPICKHPIVETTKPPTYLFNIPSMSKSMKSKTQHRANPLARRQAATPTSFPLGPPPRPVQSSNRPFR